MAEDNFNKFWNERVKETETLLRDFMKEKAGGGDVSEADVAYAMDVLKVKTRAIDDDSQGKIVKMQSDLRDMLKELREVRQKATVKVARDNPELSDDKVAAKANEMVEKAITTDAKMNWTDQRYGFDEKFELIRKLKTKLDEKPPQMEKLPEPREEKPALDKQEPGDELSVISERFRGIMDASGLTGKDATRLAMSVKKNNPDRSAA